MDLEQLEALALADDRAAALANLLPGTPEHDYWRGVHLQHAGALEEVDALLAQWKRRHGRNDELYTRLQRRQLLLRAGADLRGQADKIRFEARVRLDDQAEAVTAAQRSPTRLDPALIAEEALVRDALGRANDLSHVTAWALPDLVKADLDASQRRHLLQRLTQTNLPGLVEMIAEELGEKASRGFGSLPIHDRLTSAQLEALAALRPDVARHPRFVSARIVRLRPPAHVDWRDDLDARAAYLDALWAYVSGLPAAYNSLKSQVLYHRLDLDRRRDAIDFARLFEYLTLPRKARYAASDRLRGVPNDQVIDLGNDPTWAHGLPPIGDDEPLVRELFERRLITDDGHAFADFVRADWLDELRATARLLAGAPEPERWAAALGPARLAALRDRVDLEITANNPTRVAADATVALELAIKNVPQLVIKTYRIDAVAYFLARGVAVDTDLDLDGLCASDEQTLRFDTPAIQRVRRRIALPGCDRPGLYVIEVIGNGKASRALIRKGGLRHTLRVGVAGPTIRVLDARGQATEGARIWLNGREYAPRDDGAISIPFSTHPQTASMLLVHGDVTQVETLHHPAEVYQFAAGVHLERESLVPGKVARALIRPSLRVAGWPAPLALVDEPKVEISVTDRGGTTSTKSEALRLVDDADLVVELHVPEDARHVRITVRGRIRVASTQTTIDVADGASAEIGAIHGELHTEALHLAASAEGHVLHLLGKTGEPRGGRAVALSLRHRAVTFEAGVTLETDADGRIDLGELRGIDGLTATLPSGVTQSWTLAQITALPDVVHAIAGEAIRLPRPLHLAAADLSLVELRAGAPARDASEHLIVRDRTIEVTGGLTAGDYSLRRRGVEEALRLTIAPADATVTQGWATAGLRSIELSPALPVIDAIAVDDDALTLTVADAGPRTRVHVIATHFTPEPLLGSLQRPASIPRAITGEPALSYYLSGRDIGDEYRYVLDRRNLPRRPGMLLDRPGLLLNPWALRATTSEVQQARPGAAVGASRRPSPSAPPEAKPVGFASFGGAAGGFASLDFLPAPAIVLANLRVDGEGRLRIRRDALGDAQSARIVVVDPAFTSDEVIALPATTLSPRDRRLRHALDPAGHFSERRDVEAAPAGARLVVEDVRSGKLELVDTIARAHQVLLALGGLEVVREFAFLGHWHALDDATRRARYARYACHELHLFLYFRDPDFFARVIAPYLAHKRQKTFVDRWLLGQDLKDYCEPWAFSRLNAMEMALLARRLPEVRSAVVRLLGEVVDLIPPDPERDARLVNTLLGTAALEGGGVAAAAGALATLDEADELAEAPMKERAKKSARRRERADDAPMDAEESAAPPPTARAMRAPGAPPPPPPAAPRGPGRGGGGGEIELQSTLGDLRERERAAPLYRGADKTQEWAESDYWKIRVRDAGPSLVAVNRFWRDFAAHESGPFLSPHVGECAHTATAALGALAVLDLPFVAGAHEVVVEDARLTLTCASPSLAARTRIVAAELAETRAPLLVGQSYFRADDRWEWDGAESREKYVDGELLVGVVYQCQVVVTNPTSRTQRLQILLQIPRGALPVADGFYTRTIDALLGPHATHAAEYAFYFPAPGRYGHFPAHVTQGGALVGHAARAELEVVVTPTRVDVTSWAHVSQHGSLDEVLAFLERANLGRVELAKIAWRMRDRDAFTRVLDLLSARRWYHDPLWSYALHHADRRRVAEWLRHQDNFLRAGGLYLSGGIVDVDPIARGWAEHLEYAPLVSARAHQLGARRQVMNSAPAAQLQTFLEIVAHRPAPTDDDLLAAAHYYFSLDRIDDALAALARVDRARVATGLQYDYLAAYAACCRGDLKAARGLAEPWRDHPVERWRSRFAALVAMLDEAEGQGPALAVSDESREQRMNELAARQPALEISAAGDRVTIQHHNLETCELRFYRMDLELLFSRQPFVQGDVARFSWIDPGALALVALTGEGRTSIEIPAAMRGANLVIDAVASGLRRSLTHFAHDLAIQLAHHYGQLRVLRASTQTPLPATYVKVYGRQRGGAVQFYKDGYTDLRGRFDYSTLSTDDLDRIERFAILVVSDEAGATVLEADPPPR